MCPKIEITEEQIHQYNLLSEVENYGRVPSRFIGTGKMGAIVKFEKLDKGCLVWIDGERYPMRGCISYDKVRDLTKVKRIIPLFVRFIDGKGEFKTNWFQKILIAIGATQYWKLFLEIAHWQLKDVCTEEKFYSQPVREIYRIIDNEKIRDVLCAIIEYDTAYRYRFQDIAQELDKDLFDKNPIKELKRLFKIYKERDAGNFVGNKFGKVIPLFINLLVFRPKLLKKIKTIVSKLNIEEIRLSKEDIYWTNSGIYGEHNYRGKTDKERLKEYEIAKNF